MKTTKQIIVFGISFLISLPLIFLYTKLFPIPDPAPLKSPTENVLLTPELILQPRFISSREAGGDSISYCLVDQSGGEHGLIGIGRSGVEAFLIAANSCVAGNRFIRRYPLVCIPSNKSASSLCSLPIPIDIPLNVIEVKVFGETLRDMIFARFGETLGASDGNINDIAYFASKVAADHLSSFSGFDQYIRMLTYRSAWNSIFHQSILWFFITSIFGISVFYFQFIFSSSFRTRNNLQNIESNVEIYEKMLEHLPTVGLVGTIMGLLFTLANFLYRQSDDAALQALSNSASLGGIILALTTTLLAAVLFVLGEIFVVSPLRSWAKRIEATQLR